MFCSFVAGRCGWNIPRQCNNLHGSERSCFWCVFLSILAASCCGIAKEAYRQGVSVKTKKTPKILQSSQVLKKSHLNTLGR